MEISNLPISPSHRGKLLSAGYTTLASLSSVSPTQLAQELNIALQEAYNILKITTESSRFERWDEGPSKGAALLSHSGAKTAWDMLSEEQSQRRITTCSEKFDVILGGGIHLNEVTEVGGVPGIGKTQLGIQLAVSVQIPVDVGGVGGKAVYIDTEGSFMVERAHQIAEACIRNTLDKFVFQRKDLQPCQEKMQPNNFLSDIFYFRICSYTEQIAVINYLQKFLEDHKNVNSCLDQDISMNFYEYAFF